MKLIKEQTELTTPVYTREEMTISGALVYRAYMNDGKSREVIAYASGLEGYNIDSSQFWEGDSLGADEVVISPANFRSVWDSAIEYLTPQF